MTYTKSYYVLTLKTRLFLWIARRFNWVVYWLKRRCDHQDCESCVHHDDYGCTVNFYNGDCTYEPEVIE